MTFDVAVIGAGVIGCAVARKVAQLGASVVVIDADKPGTRASWAAAGMLAPQVEAEAPGAFFSLLLRARAAFPGLADRLRAETAIDIGYRRDGLLLVARSDEEQAELDRRHAWQADAGLSVRKMSGEAARRMEPALSRTVQAALIFPEDHQVETRSLTRALWFAAHQAGASFQLGSAVRAISGDADHLRLELADGRGVEAGRVVLAAGAWSGRILGLPRPVPVEPVHGELIAFETAPPLFRHTIRAANGYLVPRAEGRLIVGATEERIGFEGSPTEQGLARLRAMALDLAPGLANCDVDAHWSGLRPGTPDGLPILGPDPDLPNLIYATGHYRNGILLAPLTGEIIGALALGASSPVDLTPFEIGRF